MRYFFLCMTDKSLSVMRVVLSIDSAIFQWSVLGLARVSFYVYLINSLIRWCDFIDTVSESNDLFDSCNSLDKTTFFQSNVFVYKIRWSVADLLSVDNWYNPSTVKRNCHLIILIGVCYKNQVFFTFFSILSNSFSSRYQ